MMHTTRAWSPGHGLRGATETRVTTKRYQAATALNNSSFYSAPIGLRLWRIGGDGRCMFRALVQGAYQLDKGKYPQVCLCFWYIYVVIALMRMHACCHQMVAWRLSVMEHVGSSTLHTTTSAVNDAGGCQCSTQKIQCLSCYMLAKVARLPVKIGPPA